MGRTHHAREVERALQHVHEGEGSPCLITESWRRCVSSYGIDPGGRRRPAVEDWARVRERRDRFGSLFPVARAEMESLYRQISSSGYSIILTDDRGFVLDRLSDPALEELFSAADLRPGALWSEEQEGTNGIGTCIKEQGPVTVHRGEHLRYDHVDLTCSAAPILDTSGDLMAVLDASSVNPGEGAEIQSHTRALVTLSARMIENSLFRNSFRTDWVLRFHSRIEFVGMLYEGIIALDEKGRIKALNNSALALLGASSRSALLGLPIEEVFGLSLDLLMLAHGHGCAQGGGARPIELRHCESDRLFFAQINTPLGAYRNGGSVQVRPAPASAPPAVLPRRPAVRREQVALSLDELAGGEPGLQDLVGKIRKLHARPLPILLRGETGTGKDVFAHAIHAELLGRAAPFVAINCAALPAQLLESELFGYAPGAFTGAKREGFKGRIFEANGGTLFLDEIGDMPFEAQTRLLRVLEEGKVTPLGDSRTHTVDFRVISATHQDLERRCEEGLFRWDLFYRLKGLEAQLPALRDRRDKLALMQGLLSQIAQPGEADSLSFEAARCLLSHRWPGNIRELRHVLQGCCLFAEGREISVADLPQALQGVIEAAPVRERAELADVADEPVGDRDAGPSLRSAERDALLEALNRHRWHVTRTAQSLGVSRNTLYRKLRRHGIRRKLH